MENTDGSGRKHSNWPRYLAYGCGSCLVLLVLAYFVLGIAISALLAHFFSTATKTPTGPFKFDYTGAATCTVTLPDGYGSVTYLHVLVGSRGGGYGEGERALRLDTKYHKKLVRPLVYYAPERTRVGFYWYPASNGKGPHLKLLDPCGETVVDLQRGVTRDVLRLRGRMYAGDLVDGWPRHAYGTDYTSGRPKTVGVRFNDKPGEDVTNTFSGKRQYLGSIVRKGNTLTFEKPAEGPPVAAPAAK